jgi:hypothetical protein
MANVKVVSKDSKGDEVIVYVKKPSPKETSEAKIQSNILASRLLNTKDGVGKPAVILRSQIDAHLRSLEVWSEEDEKKIKDISKSITAKERQLASGGSNGLTKVQARDIARDIIKLRDEQTEIFSKRSELDRLTLESQTEQANFDCLVTLCLLDDSGNRIFSTVEEYQENVTQPYTYDAAVELSKIVFGTSEDGRKKLPEYAFLVKYGFMDESFRWIRKDGKLIDIESGKLINKEGRWINESGEFVDSNGDRIDEQGNPIEEFKEFLE